MDIAWEGCVQGRIHILLSRESSLARQFTVLSTGEQGASYAHSRFSFVRNKGCPTTEYIGIGNPDLNQETYQAKRDCLLLRHSVYNRIHEAGNVWAPEPDHNVPFHAQFHIVTGEGDGTYTDTGGRGGYPLFINTFGKVQDGLEVLREAAKLSDVSEVEIEDCGVVIPFRYTPSASCCN